MKKLIYLIVLALILGLVLTGCSLLSNIGQAPANEQSGVSSITKIVRTNGSSDFSVTLYAGQDEPVGTVEGIIDGTSLTITYETTGCWEMSETHLHVASSLEGIPHTQKGNPIPGQFGYSTSHNPWVSTYTYNITLEKELGPCEKLYIAAHADVKCLAEHCIYFEDYDEKDPVSLETTPNGPVNFYMTDYSSLSNLEVGDYALLAPSGSLPVVSSPATNTNPEDTYPNIVAFTTGGPKYKEADDIVLDDHGTGAGGNMLTDPQDTSQTELMWHAYSQFLGIVIDVTGLNWVKDMSLVTVDLDHGELWHFLYFDAGGFLIHKDTIEAGTGNYDGEAFPMSWSDDMYSIAKVVVFGEMNNNVKGVVGYAIDNICITSAVQEETAWGDGERFVEKGNWATYIEYQEPPEDVCIDFSALVLEPGDSIEELGTVYTGLEIDAVGGNAVVLMPGDVTAVTYGAPNGTSSIKNGCMDTTGGFADIDRIHHYVFTFDGKSVSEFSLHMLDFGDLNPDHATHHLVTMTAYSDVAGTVEVDTDILEYNSDSKTNPRTSPQYDDLYYTGDACDAEEGEPGNWTWEVSGTGIVRIELLVLEGPDPNIAFDELCFTIECSFPVE